GARRGDPLPAWRGLDASRARGPLGSLGHPHHAYLPAARRGAERGPDRGLSRQLRWSAAARARRRTAGRSPRKTWRANGALRFRPAVRFTARRKPPVVSVRSSCVRRRTTSSSERCPPLALRISWSIQHMTKGALLLRAAGRRAEEPGEERHGAAVEPEQAACVEARAGRARDRHLHAPDATAMARDAAQEEPAARPVEALPGLVDREHVLLERRERGRAVPAAR